MNKLAGNRRKKQDTKGLSASLTVECALVLPLFVTAVLVFCFFFRLMELQLYLQSAITQAAQETASYGYVYRKLEAKAEKKQEELLSGVFGGMELSNLFFAYADDTALKWVTAQYISNETLEHFRVVDGWKGVRFSGSALRDDANCVRLQIRYQVRVPFTATLLPPLQVTQTAVCRMFSGVGESGLCEEPAEGMVYVTETGSVYHLDRNCTHLRLSVQEVTSASLGDRRNNKGGKYYACDHCTTGETLTEKVYISDEGGHYHIDRGCSGLTRTVYEKPLEEVSDRKACSRCSKGKD